MLVLWALLLIFVLIKTTEDFFAPSLAKLSERLQLSNNVAVRPSPSTVDITVHSLTPSGSDAACDGERRP